MSAINSQESERLVSFLTPHLSKGTIPPLVSQLIWSAFDQVSHNSLKLKLFKVIPISVSVKKLSSLIELLVGQRPFPK